MREQFQHKGETRKKGEEHDRAKKRERDGKAYLRKKLKI